MTQILSLPTKTFIERTDRNRKFSYQANSAQALASEKFNRVNT